MGFTKRTNAASSSRRCNTDVLGIHDHASRAARAPRGATANGSALTLLVDGKVQATTPYTGTIDTSLRAITIGNGSGAASAFSGRIDDVQLRADARSASELVGYVRTHRPHVDLLTTVTRMTMCSNGTRCAESTYDGPSLRPSLASPHIEGGRYYASTRVATGGIDGRFGAPDWFEVRSNVVTLSVPPTVSFGAVAAGQIAEQSIATTLNCTAACTLLATSSTEQVALSNGSAGTIDRFGQAVYAAPETWGAGAFGFGLTVLDVNGTKDAPTTTRWGSGLVFGGSLKFAGVGRTPIVLVAHPGSGGVRAVQLGARLRPPPTMPVGSYTGTIDIVAVADI